MKTRDTQPDTPRKKTGFIKIATLTKDFFNYLDTGLDPKKGYYYFVMDYNLQYQSCTDTVFVSLADIVYSYNTDFQIYPNPSHDKVYLFSPTIDLALIDIIDSKGRSIHFTITYGFGDPYIDVSSFPSGIYFVNCQKSDTILHKKIIKM